MNATTSKTIFITGATGLVGSHATEEALKRGHRVRALVRPTSDTRWLDQWGVETIVGDLEDPEALRAGRRRGRLGLQLRGQGRRLGHAGGVPPAQRRGAPPAARRRRPTPGSSGSSTSARSASTKDATITGPTRPCPPPPIRSTPIRGRRPRPRPWCSNITARTGCPRRSSGPGFIYGERDRTVLPKLLDQPPARQLRLLRLGRAGAQLHLRQEPGPRDLPRRREPRGGRRGLQPDRRRAGHQEAVRRPRRRAGGPEAADPATSRCRLARVLANVVEGGGQAPRRQEPAAHQQGPLQVPRPEPRLLDRKGTPRARLPAPVHLRAGHRARHGRAPAQPLPQPAAAAAA